MADYNTQYDFSGNPVEYDYTGLLNTPKITSTAIRAGYKSNPIDSVDGLLGNANINTGVNSDLINSNLQSSIWNKNLGTVTDVANLALLGLNYGDQKKTSKNNLRIQGQQIAANDFNLNKLRGASDKLASATLNVMSPKVG